MEVTKIKITRDYALFNNVYFCGDEFYASSTYRKSGSTIDVSDIYKDSGEFIGEIRGYWFDYANKTLFERTTTKPE